jgi:hypothetical protein
MDNVNRGLLELESRLRAAWVDPRDAETVERVRQRMLAEMARHSLAPKPWWRPDWPVSAFAVGFAAGAAVVLIAVGLASRGHLAPIPFSYGGTRIQPTASATPAAVFLPACLPADIPLSVEAPATTGSVIITVKASNSGDSCHLHTRITVVPQGSSGLPLAVTGSPATAPADTDLPYGASGTPIAVYAWANWCGGAGPFGLSASMPDQPAAAISVAAGPRCVDRARPSQLVSLSMPAVTVVSLPLAERTITGFYDAINAHDYPNAYAYLGIRLQANQPYRQFVAGFADTVRDDLVQLYVQTIRPDGTVTVHVDFIAHRTQDSSEYAGTYVIGYEAGEPRLLSGQLTELWRKPQP